MNIRSTGKVRTENLTVPKRIFTRRWGTHETLLACHSHDACWKTAPTPSFVNRIADANLYRSMIGVDPVEAVEKLAQSLAYCIREIPLPRDLYGEGRINSAGRI